MGKRKKSKKSRRNRNTPLKQHKKVGTKLLTELTQLPIAPIDWRRDFLPEFLWIEFLGQKYKDVQLHQIYDDFLDALEKHFDTEKFILSGTLSDFGRIPTECREAILREEEDKIYFAFENVIGSLLMLYPNCPANWLISEEFKVKNKINHEYELANLKNSLLRLFKAKDHYCSYIRMMPLKRMLKHQKLFFPPDIDIVKLLPKYPDQLTEDERNKVEAFSRPSVNMFLQGMGNQDYSHIDYNWCSYFWNHNFEISVCEEFTYSQEELIGKEERNLLDKIPAECDKIVEHIDAYIALLTSQYKYNIYDPSKDEIILGLFARLSRLTKLVLSSISLWTVDIARIFLRCITDTSITLVFLINENDDKLFEAFINYGLGKEKLLLLHLQDEYKESQGPSGEVFEEIQEQLGGFAVEMIDIELGAWSKVDTRKMAFKIGFEDLYRLVYDPTSADVHGNWTSVRNINLKRCINPLHRFHRLPNISDPPIFLDPLLLSISIYRKTIQKCIEKANFPEFKYEMDGLEKTLKEVSKIRESN